MDTPDAVREHLKKRGSPPFVVGGGLAGLVERWEQFGQEVEWIYKLGLDDYRNDVDGRQILEEVLPLATDAERAQYAPRVQAVDKRLWPLLEASGRCLWGAEYARRRQLTARQHWWYFSLPKKQGGALRADLRRT